MRPRTACAFALLAGVACSSPESRYDWTLRHVLQQASEAGYRDHAQVLASLIAEADADQRPPPPGLLLELGWVRLRLGEREAAAEAFAREARTWPELEALADACVTWLDHAESRESKK